MLGNFQLSVGNVVTQVNDGLLGLHGSVDGQQFVFMIDSGASANFTSSKLIDSLSLQYYNTQQFPVRLANGQMLHTYGSVVVDIIFGGYLYSGKFFVLNCDVPLILGMQFLSDVRPQVDFSNKLVSVCHNKVLYKLPTTRIVSGQQYNQQVDVQ